LAEEKREENDAGEHQKNEAEEMQDVVSYDE